MVLRKFISENFEIRNPYSENIDRIRSEYCSSVIEEEVSTPFKCDNDSDNCLPKICCDIGSFIGGMFYLPFCLSPFFCCAIPITKGIFIPICSSSFMLVGAATQVAIAAPWCLISSLANAICLRTNPRLDRLNDCCLQAASLSFVRLRMANTPDNLPVSAAIVSQELRSINVYARDNSINNLLIINNLFRPSYFAGSDMFDNSTSMYFGTNVNLSSPRQINLLGEVRDENINNDSSNNEITPSYSIPSQVNKDSKDAIFNFLNLPNLYIEDPLLNTFYYESAAIELTSSLQLGAVNQYNKVFLEYVRFSFLINQKNEFNNPENKESLNSIKQSLENYVGENLCYESITLQEYELIAKNLGIFLAACENYGKKDSQDLSLDNQYSSFSFYWERLKAQHTLAMPPQSLNSMQQSRRDQIIDTPESFFLGNNFVSPQILSSPAQQSSATRDVSSDQSGVIIISARPLNGNLSLNFMC